MPLPIVFIHRGYSNYLEFSLRQARASNPDAPIILLGDASNDRFPFVTHVDQAEFAGAGDDFARIYRHMSTNGRNFEIVCFQRWFMLRAFLQQYDFDAAFVLDSDVLLYASLQEIARNWLDEATLGLCIPAQHEDDYRWVASPHVAYWARERLEDFCAFALDLYERDEARAWLEEKWHRAVSTGDVGGICDMTALYRFVHDSSGGFVNFTMVRDGMTFDYNINSAENHEAGAYLTSDGRKIIRWRDGRPFGHHQPSDEEVRFLALHCQGQAKAFMGRYYTGPAFPRQRWLETKLSALFTLRRHVSRHLVQPLRHLQARIRA